MSEDRADHSAETPQWTCLDLFCGLGGFSAAFEDSPEWEVVTVDIEARFDPDIQADVMDLRPSDLPQADVVLASPPCTDFSPVARTHGTGVEIDGTPVTDSARESVALAYHTLGLINAIAPDYWYLENPKGALRWVIGYPEATVDYCAYGHYCRKPTDLWGEHAPMRYRHCGHQSHTDADGVTDFERGPKDASDRAKLPYELSQSIRSAVEEAFENPPPEQTQLPVAATDGGVR